MSNNEINMTNLPQPRRSIAFIGSECYPFVKTGGLGDVMYALPKALIKQNCDESKMGKFIDDIDTWLADAQALMLKKGGGK